MKKVSLKYITNLINKYTKSIPFEQKELNNFYTYLDGDEIYICCCNSGGDCFIEEFQTLDAVKLYLKSDMDIEEIYAFDLNAKKQQKYAQADIIAL